MKIRITTPSRLHLGFFDFGNESCSRYDSAGVTIQKPNFVIEAETSDTLKVEGVGKEKAMQYAKIFIKEFNLRKNVKIKILESIPEHVGLGSGTQLALGVGAAIVKIFGLEISVDEIAKITGRGNVSRIGICAFESGGFIVDDEKDGFNCPLPENWQWIVAIPKNEKGLSSRKEELAFKNIPEIPGKKIGELQKIEKRIVKAAIEKDIVSFGKAVTELDRKNGELFSERQKGIYYNKDVEKGINLLLKNGAYGAGQSSWGPGFYGLIGDENRALAIKEKLTSFFCNKAEVFITKTNNRCAETTWLER